MARDFSQACAESGDRLSDSPDRRCSRVGYCDNPQSHVTCTSQVLNRCAQAETHLIMKARLIQILDSRKCTEFIQENCQIAGQAFVHEHCCWVDAGKCEGRQPDLAGHTCMRGGLPFGSFGMLMKLHATKTAVSMIWRRRHTDSMCVESADTSCTIYLALTSIMAYHTRF